MDDVETNPLKEVKFAIEESNYEPSKTNIIRRKDTGFLLFTVLTGSMICIYNGLSYVWPSSAIPKMESNVTEENPLGRPITTFETSMLAGLPTLALLLGTIVMGYVSEFVGRKGSVQIASVGICISIIAISFSNNIIGIITFRCICFFFANGGSNVFSMYVIEICEDHNRAKYGCLASAFSHFGQMMGYCLGALLNFKYFNLVGLSPMIILFTFFFFAPESLVYNVSKHKLKKCMKDLKMLRNNKNEKELETDLRSIYYTVKTSVEPSRKKMLVLKLVNTKEKRYSLMLASSIVIFQIFSGFGIIIPFMEPIFIATGTKFNSSHLPMIVSSFKFVTSFLTSVVVEKFGRRPLLVISSTGAGASLLALGCFFYLRSIESPLIHQLQWFPLACLISYIILCSLGMYSIPQATMGELFTPDVRSTAISFVCLVFAFFLFCSTSTYPYIVEYVGLHWCLWLYAFLSLSSAVIMYLIIPETNGKSIDEIQEYIKSCCNKI